MSPLTTTLQGLSDARAIALLQRLLQVLPLPSGQPGASVQARAQALAVANSLSPASTGAGATTPGALARTALLALAELPDVAPALYHLLALQTTSRQAFASPLPVAELSTQLLAVLEWQLAGSAGNASHSATALGGLRSLAGP